MGFISVIHCIISPIAASLCVKISASLGNKVCICENSSKLGQIFFFKKKFACVDPRDSKLQNKQPKAALGEKKIPKA